MAFECLIIDDEPIALDIIESFVDKTPMLVVSGRCRNALEGYEFLQRQHPDLLFLDIEMPELSGLELLNLVNPKPAVILTTAYRNYALESYEYEVLDYLLKPISYERFLKSIDKFLRWKKQPTKTSDHLFIRVNKAYKKVYLQDIYYLEGLRDYVKLVTRDGTLITHDTLKYFENELEELGFIRTHKSYIVSLSKVSGVESNIVYVSEQKIPIGRIYKNNLIRQLKLK